MDISALLRRHVAREGGQGPFYGSAGVLDVGVLGLIRRGRPIECAAVESFSILDSILQPSRARTGMRAHEHGWRAYRSRNKPTCCRANWSGNEIAIGSHRRIHQLYHPFLSPATQARHPKMVHPAGGAQSRSCLCLMSAVGDGGRRPAPEARDPQSGATQCPRSSRLARLRHPRGWLLV